MSETPARIITSIAMFYDLEDPVAFARDVRECLAPDGVWHFEQSYMPSMLRFNAYDTVCHEHLEYYSLANVRRILGEADLEIVDVRFNRVNGGSFAVTARPPRLAGRAAPRPDRLVHRAGGARRPRHARARTGDSRSASSSTASTSSQLIRTLRADGASVMGYGASTKGNVLLQFCGFTPEDIEAIAEVNPDKFGRVTPGIGHPDRVRGRDARRGGPTISSSFPWHFRDSIVEREEEYLRSGGRLIFPLPEIEIVGA